MSATQDHESSVPIAARDHCIGLLQSTGLASNALPLKDQPQHSNLNIVTGGI